MKKTVLALSLMVLFSVIGVSMAASSNVADNTSYLTITETATQTDSIGSMIHSDGSGHYMVVDLIIENHGYPTVTINPNDFFIQATDLTSGAKGSYMINSATNYLASLGKDPLSLVELANGEVVKGSLAYYTPLTATEMTLNYKLDKEFTIRWNAPGNPILTPLGK